MGKWKPQFLIAIMILSILPVMDVDAGGGKSSSHSVDIQNWVFDPQDITIFVGDSITWTNQDSTSHTATSNSGPDSFDSGNMQSSAAFTYTFTASGTYNYECAIHPSMTGTITVEAPAVRVRDTLTNFTWQPEQGEAQPNNVSIIGEWDWNTHSDLTFDSNSGIWSTSISLQEGLYCYKFVVGENDYRFDLSNPYRGYCGDFENSIARIENTNLPSLSLDSYSIEEDGINAKILFWAGGNNAAPDSVSATVMHNFVESNISGIWDSNDWSLNLSIDELTSGKYTLKVVGKDINNHDAEELLLPFWIGDQSNFIWDDALIYMVMTDRFVDGNPSNNAAATTAAQGADWLGGDFAGVTQMIQAGYFNNLGVNALWLTPFNTAANGTEFASDGQHEVSSYHGYWPIEPREVDNRLGTEIELENLISAAHENGIRVMGDFVVNHVHEDHPYYTNNPDWFNQGCLCGTQNCDWTEHRLDCQFRSYMPDLNWKNRAASEQMIADGLWWLERFDLDGARIDAVKHVDDLAIYNFGTQVKERFESMGTDYYLKGETAMGWAGHNLQDNANEYGTINNYIGPNGLDGQADFVLYHAVVDNVFTSGNMDYQHLDYWTARSQEQYEDGAIMVPFVGSHDVPRFTSRADPGTNDEWNQWQEDGLPGEPGTNAPYRASLQAHSWLLTTPGAAVIYQGDEYGEYGGADPDNRHLWRSSENWNHREQILQENISSLGALRLELDTLRRGGYSSIYNSSEIVVFSREYGGESSLIALNRGQTTENINIGTMFNNHSIAFGSASINNTILTIPVNSVSILTNEELANNTPLEPEIPGCLDENATNHNPNATEDDGSCEYATQGTTYPNLEYASYDGGTLLLDLYVPEGIGPHPLFIYIHGGGWISGNKQLHPESPALQLYEEGTGKWAVASIEYRLSSEAIWPAQIEDCKAAIRWLKENSENYGIDSEMIIAGGSSAGGHLAAMLAVTNGDTLYDNASLGSMSVTSEINGVVDWFGPSDMYELANHAEANVPNRPWVAELLLNCTWDVDCSNLTLISASPALLVEGDEPPILILHGTNDTSVPPSQSEIFAASLEENDSTYEYHLIQGAGHGISNQEWRDGDVMIFLLNFIEGVRNGTINSTLNGSVICPTDMCWDGSNRDPVDCSCPPEPEPEPEPEPCDDGDEDGICNDDDSCPNTPFWFTAVDEDGCIIIYDGDEDGIPDGEDGCPNTPFENRSMVGYDGCIPDDLDNDNIEWDNSSSGDEDNKDSTTETGGIESGRLIVYALMIILVMAIIGYILMYFKRP